ncbi:MULTISPECIES: hypothetical protein [Cohnella]|nr:MULTISPECIES: hypothetical protein [Cohnella]
MLNLYRYMVQQKLKRLGEIPEPYQSKLREEGLSDFETDTEN